MNSWDAARAAQHRPLPKPYKPVAPVGERPSNFHEVYIDRWGSGAIEAYRADFSCDGCGYHVCNCPPAQQIVPPPYGTTVGGIEIRYSQAYKPGEYVFAGTFIVCGLLSSEELKRVQTLTATATAPRT